jgi:hypothetical protein
MNLLKTFLLACTSLLSVCSIAQVINGYAKVTGVAGTTINLSNVDQSGGTFTVGDQVIVMQMQDDVIGANTIDNINFGTLSNIQSAGLFEIRVIQSITGGGTPTSLTLNAITNTYNTGVNSSVQVITFPELGSPDYTTTANMSALAWDGNIGGVVAFQVSGVLTLAHNIDANQVGFRGAAANLGNSTGCTGSSNYSVPTQDHHADKGEGIYKVTDPNYAAGRARILSGGGGGNSHNAGGGGGSNFSIGGLGGPGWPNCSPTAGGMGGIDLSPYIDGSRIFMGGGGGAGEGNNGGSQIGGTGGGIVIIKANEITTVGPCAGITISANGSSVTNGAGNDGNSGGGAAGTIMIDAATWSIDATCDLTMNSNGGDGGDVTHNGFHGAGGGGGQGAVIYTNTQPTTNTTTNTIPGEGGQNCNTCGDADDGGGSNGDGIVNPGGGVLPVELIEFVATPNEFEVLLDWATASEINNDYFLVEKSTDGFEWITIGMVNGEGNSTDYNFYDLIDPNPFLETSYYRLKQVDFDGRFEYSNIVSVNFKGSEKISLFPNPSNNFIKIQKTGIIKNQLKIYSSLGNLINLNPNISTNEAEFDIQNLANGIYLVQILSNNGELIETLKFQVQR